jgi:predicted permease
VPDWKEEINKRLTDLKLEPVREQEIIEELSQHMELLYAELRAEGMTETEANQLLQDDLNDSEFLTDELRRIERQIRYETIVLETGRSNMIRDTWQDLQYGVRMLRKSPGFSAVAILTLALGIGANTAMFSVLNTYLFRALPYPEPERLVRIYRTSLHSQSWPHSAGNFFDYQDQNTVFDYAAAFTWTSINMSESGEPAERVQCMTTTANFFNVLGVHPALGRVFTQEEEMIPANGVVVLSHNYWMRRFGGDPNVVGRKLKLNGWDAEIIGVMPPGVEYPLLWNTVDMWGPQPFTAETRRDRDSNFLQAFGRLKPGVTIDQAEQSMIALAANIGKEIQQNANDSLRLEPLSQSTSDEVGRAVMWFTFGLAGFVLAIACANLANLQLVRTAARSREYAVRAALGAGRNRLLRQSLTESLTISIIGGILSLIVAFWGVEFISNRLFSQLPGAKVELDYRVFGFAFLASVITGLVFGTVPAWIAARADVNQALRENSRGSTGGRSHNRLRHALIIGEVAFALVLLTGAGLFLRGLQRFTGQDPGWNVDGLVMAQLALQGPKYVNSPERGVFAQQVEEKLRTIPGVEKVGVSMSPPIWSFYSSGSFRVEGQPEPEPGKWPETFFEPVSTEYFQTLGARLLEGRAFTPDDKAGGPRVVIINETMARRYWPNESAVGKRIGSGSGDNTRWSEIIGVVGDMDFPANLEEPYTHFQTFYPLTREVPYGGMSIFLRTSLPADSIANALRGAVADVDPSQSVYQIKNARSLVDQGLGSISLLGSLLGAFAALGLVLAAIGIYGVTAYSVAQRTGEIGVRMALGAQQKDVIWLIVSRGARLSLTGAVIGVGGAYAVSQLLQWAIPNLPSRDPVTFAAITFVLILVTIFACWIPARRASRVDPMTALRSE